MVSLENNKLKMTIDNFNLYKWYVDDIFIIRDNKYNLSHLLKTFNNYHPAISFTLEVGNKQNVQFLDLEMTEL